MVANFHAYTLYSLQFTFYSLPSIIGPTSLLKTAMTFKKILTHIVIPVFIVAAILAGYYIFGKIRAAQIYEETHSTIEEAVPEKSVETPEPTTNYKLQ